MKDILQNSARSSSKIADLTSNLDGLTHRLDKFKKSFETTKSDFNERIEMVNLLKNASFTFVTPEGITRPAP